MTETEALNEVRVLLHRRLEEPETWLAAGFAEKQKSLQAEAERLLAARSVTRKCSAILELVTASARFHFYDNQERADVDIAARLTVRLDWDDFGQDGRANAILALGEFMRALEAGQSRADMIPAVRELLHAFEHEDPEAVP